MKLNEFSADRNKQESSIYLNKLVKSQPRRLYKILELEGQAASVGTSKFFQ